MNLQEIKEHIERLQSCIIRIENAAAQIEVTKQSPFFIHFSTEAERDKELSELKERQVRFEETLRAELRYGKLLMA